MFKTYEIEQMDTVITVYVDLRENFVQWECTCRARQHSTWKRDSTPRENRTCLSCTTITTRTSLHCALLQVSAFHSVVSCSKWVFHHRVAKPLAFSVYVNSLYTGTLIVLFMSVMLLKVFSHGSISSGSNLILWSIDRGGYYLSRCTTFREWTTLREWLVKCRDRSKLSTNKLIIKLIIISCLHFVLPKNQSEVCCFFLTSQK